MQVFTDMFRAWIWSYNDKWFLLYGQMRRDTMLQRKTCIYGYVPGMDMEQFIIRRNKTRYSAPEKKSVIGIF